MLLKAVPATSSDKRNILIARRDLCLGIQALQEVDGDGPNVNVQPARLRESKLALAAGKAIWAESSGGGCALRKSCDDGRLEGELDALLLMDQRGIVPSVQMYKHLLQACIAKKDLNEARKVHAHIAKNELESDRFLGEWIVNTLVSCGSLEEGLQVFQRLLHPTTFAWTSLITGYAKAGRCREALSVYQWMQEESPRPNKHMLVCLLKACGKLRDLVNGRMIHASIVRDRWEFDVFVGTALLDMYAKCGSLLDARYVFDKQPERNVVSWNAMLAAYSQHNRGEKALQLYDQMQKEGVSPDDRTFVSVLQACSSMAEEEEGILLDGQCFKVHSLRRGKAVHAAAARKGYEGDVFVVTTLVSMYAKSGSITDAEQLFNRMSFRNVVSWNAMLSGYAQQDQGETALRLYLQMQQNFVIPNDRTFVSVLQACGSLAEKEEAWLIDGQFVKVKALRCGKAAHAEAVSKDHESDQFIRNGLISMYAKCGSMVDAQQLFNRFPKRDVVTWTAMIDGYTQQSLGKKALQLFDLMSSVGVAPDDRTFIIALQACGVLAEEEEYFLVDGHSVKLESLQRGKTIHAAVLRSGYESDEFVASTLVSMYAKCGREVDAKLVFGTVAKCNVVAWSSMLAAYAQRDQGEKALQLYCQMQEAGVHPNKRTFVSVLQACGSLAEKEDSSFEQAKYIKPDSLIRGKAMHAEVVRRGLESDVYVGNALISMYAKCGSMIDAQHVFDRLPKRNVVSWTALLSGYAQQDQAEKSLQQYAQMQAEGLKPTAITYVCILHACSSIGALNHCIQIHRDILESGYETHPHVATALVHAYAKSGSMSAARAMFDSLPLHSLRSWTALLAGYARHGQYESSLQCYQKLCLQGMEPDGVTFLCLLSACSHAGMVCQGLEYFRLMTTQHGLAAGMGHYMCVLDLLGRAGVFHKAEELLLQMPFQPNLDLWLSLLGACQKHGNVVLGRHAFNRAVELQPKESAAYVIMSNLYAHASMWDSAKEIDEMRHSSGARKTPGHTWIEHEQEVYTFWAADRRYGVLLGLLNDLNCQLKNQ